MVIFFYILYFLQKFFNFKNKIKPNEHSGYLQKHITDFENVISKLNFNYLSFTLIPKLRIDEFLFKNCI